MFLVEDGVVRNTVAGLLSWGVQWCIGAYDGYQRVDTELMITFLECVTDAKSMKAACRCGAENQLGLCDDL